MIGHLTKANWPQYQLLMRMDRPIGSYLLLWPTLWALWIASNGSPSLLHLLVFTIGVFVMRSAGCVINDYADRHFDGHVERTKNRPLVAGRVLPKEAIQLFLLLIGIGFLLVLTLNFNTILLSVVAVLLAASYPFMKRYTHLPQVVLGAAFSWSIPMAFMAVDNQLNPVVWILYFANLSWTVAYDTMYGMVDRDDDVKLGLKSTAILFAQYDKTAVAVLQLFSLLLLLYLGFILHLHSIYYLSLLVVLGLFIYQQYLIRHRHGQGCFQAFLNNNWVGMAVFIGIVGHYLML